MRGSFFCVVSACWGLVAACGGDSDTRSGGDPDASTGGSGTGGASSAGGRLSAGGVTASGGTPGAGGGTAAPCEAPGAGETAICLTLAPEAITAETDRALDKSGALVVQVFDTPNPPDDNASAVALAETVLPPTATTGGEILLDAIAPLRLVGAFPSIVYVRALFLDNAQELDGGLDIGFGTWVGGLDLSEGLVEGVLVMPVAITPGQGNAVELPLRALRKLDVTVRRTATPVGDGQGPLNVVVVNRANLATQPSVFGVAPGGCVDLSGTGSVTLTGVVLGGDPLFVTGVLNDLGVPGELPVGSLASLDVQGTTVRIPTRLTIAPGDYSVAASIDLGFAVPLPPDAGAVPPNACSDLFPPGDGGADAAAPDAAAPDASTPDAATPDAADGSSAVPDGSVGPLPDGSIGD